MKRLALLAALVCCCSTEPVRILVLGDSITKGERSGVSSKETFAYAIGTLLGAEVINAGTPGETTRQALAHLDYVIAQHPNIVTVMYGTNDAFVENGEARVPVPEYRENLRVIIATLKSAGIRTVLMTSPRWESAKENESLAIYVQAARDVAHETQTPLVDNFARWGQPHGEWTVDLCHPNPAGHAVIAETMLPIVRDALSIRGK